MDDRDIVQLYLERKPNALDETALKYGKYCTSIAKNILGNNEDAEECVNDSYYNAWNSIPPHQPNNLATYLGKLVRNLSFDRYKFLKASKRGGGEIEIVLDELAECVSGNDRVEQEIDRKELIIVINEFLETLPKEKCNIFICRYWYAIPVSEIARRFGKSDGNISVTLNRIRNKLKSYLIERGYVL